MSILKVPLAFDIYPSAAPNPDPAGEGYSGRLARLTAPVAGFLRVEYEGTGSGTVTVHRDDPQCTAANFADGNYVDVVNTRLNKSLGGFFMPAGTVKLLSKAQEKGDQFFTVSGPGTLSYLGRVIWAATAYNGPGAPHTDHPADAGNLATAANSPRSDGQWHWPNNDYGAILNRAIAEAQDPDRPDAEIDAVTMDFDYTTDSAGATFATFSGDYTQAVGANYLDTVADMIRLGMAVRMSPQFLLQAYVASYGTDRHNSSFAAGKVRFVGGVNIADDLARTVRPNMRVKTLTVQGKSQDPADAVVVTDAGGTGEAFLSYPVTDDPAALTAAGNKNLALRMAQTDTCRFGIVGGSSPLSGYYDPSWPGDGGDFWLGDTVTIHNGTGENDYNNKALRVAAIEWKLDATGLALVTLELGSTFYDFSKPGTIAGATAPGGGCTCPVPGPTCLDTGTALLAEWTWDGTAAATYFLPAAMALDGVDHTILGPNGHPLTGDPYVGGAGASGTTYYDWVNNDAGHPPIKCSPGDVIGFQGAIGPYWNEYSGAWGIPEVRWYDSGGSVIGSAAFGADILELTSSPHVWQSISASTPPAPVGAAGFSIRIVSSDGAGTRTGGLRTYFRDQWNFSIAGSPDPLCVPALIYGTAYDPTTGLPGYYLPYGATVPAPTASEVPYGDPGGPSTKDVVDALAAAIAALPTSTGSMVPYYIPPSTTFEVPLYSQALFKDIIEVDGLLVVNGRLLGVD